LETVMSAGQRRREWMELDRDAHGQPLRVMQWNILADGLAQSGDFKYAAKEHLEWKHRFALMLAEIEEGQPDIITLQECNHFKDSWEPKLGAMGYKGLHVAKHSSPATVYGAPSDGLAVFWRDARLECRDHFNFQYSKYLDVPSNQSALLAHFTFRLPKEAMNGASSGVLLATTHLKAKVTPENDRIRHGQALELLEAVTDYSHTLAQRAGVRAEKVPIVITGDFNTKPGTAAIEKMDGSLLRLESYWSLFQEGDDGAGGEALPNRDVNGDLYSTWKFRTSECEKKCVIDYIWWRSPCMRPARCWKPLTKEIIGPGALPSATYPSDHLSLLVELMV